MARVTEAPYSVKLHCLIVSQDSITLRRQQTTLGEDYVTITIDSGDSTMLVRVKTDALRRAVQIL